MISVAYAQTAGAPAGPEALLFQFGPFVLIFAVMYFLMIRPQMKRQKEMKAMLDALQKGDEVITVGGVLGKVSKVTDHYLTVEVASIKEGPIELLVQRQAVQSVLPKGTIKSL
ncbi:preprotein translocase subunit YajC [Derxia lacustris]|uniref:preprotein translocase subunit YajC n=1 Tax=Derxia lacustris TaxID=764842 RepID=UPI000A1778A9|nr:preprotein translocase subunit YajC [Derxia lacustris]